MEWWKQDISGAIDAAKKWWEEAQGETLASMPPAPTPYIPYGADIGQDEGGDPYDPWTYESAYFAKYGGLPGQQPETPPGVLPPSTPSGSGDQLAPAGSPDLTGPFGPDNPFDPSVSFWERLFRPFDDTSTMVENLTDEILTPEEPFGPSKLRDPSYYTSDDYLEQIRENVLSLPRGTAEDWQKLGDSFRSEMVEPGSVKDQYLEYGFKTPVQMLDEYDVAKDEGGLYDKAIAMLNLTPTQVMFLGFVEPQLARVFDALAMMQGGWANMPGWMQSKKAKATMEALTPQEQQIIEDMNGTEWDVDLYISLSPEGKEQYRQEYIAKNQEVHQKSLEIFNEALDRPPAEVIESYKDNSSFGLQISSAVLLDPGTWLAPNLGVWGKSRDAIKHLKAARDVRTLSFLERMLVGGRLSAFTDSIAPFKKLEGVLDGWYPKAARSTRHATRAADNLGERVAASDSMEEVAYIVKGFQDAPDKLVKEYGPSVMSHDAQVAANLVQEFDIDRHVREAAEAQRAVRVLADEAERLGDVPMDHVIRKGVNDLASKEVNAAAKLIQEGAPTTFTRSKARIIADMQDHMAAQADEIMGVTRKQGKIMKAISWLKTMQSIILLDANPVFAMNNAFANIGKGIQTGLYKPISSFRQLSNKVLSETFQEKYGVLPKRLVEGFTPAAEATGKTFIGKFAGWHEASSRARFWDNAYGTSFKRLWNPGLSNELRTELASVDKGLPAAVESAMRSGYTMPQIRERLFNKDLSRNLYMYTDEIATRLGMDSFTMDNLLAHDDLGRHIQLSLDSMGGIEDTPLALAKMSDEYVSHFRTRFDDGFQAREDYYRHMTERTGPFGVVKLINDMDMNRASRELAHHQNMARIFDEVDLIPDAYKRDEFWRTSIASEEALNKMLNEQEAQQWAAINKSLEDMGFSTPTHSISASDTYDEVRKLWDDFYLMDPDERDYQEIAEQVNNLWSAYQDDTLRVQGEIQGNLLSALMDSSGGSQLYEGLARDYASESTRILRERTGRIQDFYDRIRPERNVQVRRKANRLFWEAESRQALLDADQLGSMRLQLQQVSQDPTLNLWLNNIDAAASLRPDEASILQQGYSMQVAPLINTLSDILGEKPQVLGVEIPPHMRGKLTSHLDNVIKPELSEARQVALAQSEAWTDYALLNYQWRSKFDQAYALRYPYAFWGVQNLSQFVVDMATGSNMGYYSALAKYENLLNEHGEDLPPRLRGKIQMEIPAPLADVLPDWVPASIYIDPVARFFPPRLFLNALKAADWTGRYERLNQDLEYALEHGASEEEIMELRQALAKEAPKTPMDFLGSIFSPWLAEGWALTAAGVKQTPYIIENALIKGVAAIAGIEDPPLMSGTPDTGPLPITRQAKDISNLVKMVNPDADIPPGGINLEAGIRRFLRAAGMDISIFDDYHDINVMKQIAYMAAEGEVNANQAMKAMIDKKGEIWDTASDRAGQQQGLKLLSLPIGGYSSVMSTGESIQNQLQVDLKQAKQSAFDQAIASGATEEEAQGIAMKAGWTWQDEHPEIKTLWFAYDQPVAQLRKYLKDLFWDTWHGMSDLQKRAFRGVAPEGFKKYFLDGDTRSYKDVKTEDMQTAVELIGAENIPARDRSEIGGSGAVEDKSGGLSLAGVLSALGVAAANGPGTMKDTADTTDTEKVDTADTTDTPGPFETTPSTDSPLVGGTAATVATQVPAHLDAQYTERSAIKDKYPGVIEIQSEYFKHPKGSQERKDIFAANPILKAYWDELAAFDKAHPELKAFVDALENKETGELEPTAKPTERQYTYFRRSYGGGGGGGRSYGGSSYGGGSMSWGQFVEKAGQEAANAVIAMIQQGKPLKGKTKAQLRKLYEADPMGFETFEEWLAFMVEQYNLIARNVPAPYTTKRQIGTTGYAPVSTGRKHISWS